jgi:hypothetical protein
MVHKDIFRVNLCFNDNTIYFEECSNYLNSIILLFDLKSYIDN